MTSATQIRVPQGQKLVSLEIGRGLAALAVVMHHAALAGNSFTQGSDGGFFERGALGVDFFFVLSGFIIYFVHGNDPRTGSAALSYFSKRVRRIYLPYLPISIFLILAYTALPSLSQGNRDWGLLTSLTLIPTDQPPALSVAWTLVYEMMFYLFFLVFFVTRHFWPVVLVWAATILACNVTGLSDRVASPFLTRALDPLVIEFILGMVAAWIFKNRPLTNGGLLFLAGLLSSVAALAISSQHNVVLAASFAVLILGAATLETARGLRFHPWAALVGAASYAIYLVHNPLISLVARLVSFADTWLVTFVVCAVASMIAGILYHLTVEKPLLRFARPRLAPVDP